MNIEPVDGLLVITFDQKVNKLNLELAENLAKIKKQYAAVKGVCLTNTGRFFCSGGDIDIYAKTRNRKEGIQINRKIRQTLIDFARWPVPKIAAVQGDCFGGGLELLMVCQHVLSLPQNLFGLWQRRQGLTTGWAGGRLLVEKLGLGKTRQLMFSAETVSAFHAKDLGIVDNIEIENQILICAMKWLHRQSELPASAGKAIYRWTPTNENKVFEGLWFNSEHQARLKAWRSRK